MMYSDDQLQTIFELSEFINQAFDPNDCKRVLTGSAGTGKTTVVSFLGNRSARPLILTALTNQAAAVLSDITEQEVTTLASALGLRLVVDPNKGREVLRPGPNRKKLPMGATLLIDECGMLGQNYEKHLAKAILDFHLNVIFVGDKYQLPPVNEKCSVFDSGIPEFELSTTHRFSEKEDGVLGTANQWRDAQTTGILPKIKSVGSIQVVGQDVFCRQAREAAETNIQKSLVVAFTNKRVLGYNQMIRKSIHGAGPDDPYEPGENLILNTTLADARSGDLIAHTGTEIEVKDVTVDQISFPSLNGQEQPTVLGTWAIEAWNDDRSYHVPQNPKKYRSVVDQLKKIALDTPNTEDNARVRRSRWYSYFRAKQAMADLRPGFARTVHKTQGSTVDQVFIDASDFKYARDPKTISRLMYVALTRARASVVITGLNPDGSII